ncbi:MAG TPA: glucoamylase family protein [Steroidobacteraceae bacterium]
MAKTDQSAAAKTRRKLLAGSTLGPSPGTLARLPNERLLEAVQRQTFRFFWEGADPISALALDRRHAHDEASEVPVTMAGSGFGIMAVIVAVERGWISRDAALAHLQRMLDFLIGAPCYHGAFSHFVNARTRATIPLTRKDDGGDLVETSFLCMGLLCARAYFARNSKAEKKLRAYITDLWEGVEWNWYTQGGRQALYWHWSPNNGWSMNHAIRGWDECLLSYVLAASAPRYRIEPLTYHLGYAAGRNFLNGKSYYGIELPLGVPYGGPLFFTHYSFCGLDPRGLKDRYADYWQQNLNHVRINYAHCVANPHRFKGYGPACWGLTASDDKGGYASHDPANDNGTISPTAAVASFPYAPRAAMRALRQFVGGHGGKLWGRYGLVDAFSASQNWIADTFLAIDQGPIILMIENYRSGLLWRLFMSVPEVQAGLRALDFTSPHLNRRTRG